VLNWSNDGYKLTLGIGSLAIAGMLSDLAGKKLPVWVALPMALLPLVVFVLVHPGELSPRVVRLAHIFASVWYLLLAAGLLVTLLAARALPRGWPVYPICAAFGAIPCVIVLNRAALNRYPPPTEWPGNGS
jgi:uncharacterized membrane protein